MLNNNGMATNLEVIVGTYEQFLLGYKVEQVFFTVSIGLKSHTFL